MLDIITFVELSFFYTLQLIIIIYVLQFAWGETFANHGFYNFHVVTVYLQTATAQEPNLNFHEYELSIVDGFPSVKIVKKKKHENYSVYSVLARIFLYI